MSASIFTTFMSGDGFTLAAIGDGVFSPASNILPLNAQQILPSSGVLRAAMRIEDIYINSDVAHDLDLYYRPSPVTVLPSPPSSALNDTLIYSYAGRTNCNPFHVDDDFSRRLKKIVFGQPASLTIPSAGGGTLQFQIPAFGGLARVTIQWSLISPGGGIGT